MSDLLSLVDAKDFEELFIEELGWSSPRGQRTYVYEGDQEYRMQRVADFKGLAVWVCDACPDASVQRSIDSHLAKQNVERLLIFCGSQSQDWRWPRRGRLGSVSNKLMLHRHQVGTPDPDLQERLEAMFIDIDDEPTLVELLQRMRLVFDKESESASAKAARLMGTLYGFLDKADVEQKQATQLLARLLFLWFGDDAGMWRKDLFQDWLVAHTTPENLHEKFNELFAVVNNPLADNSLDGKPWVLSEEFEGFRYINGGLFASDIELPALGEKFRDAVLEGSRFDWSIISPAIFGSMFQTVKDSKARRAMGEHYTTEENILRTLRPLFLDELEERFERAKDSKAELTKLHNHLGTIQVMDPACGCGNFLIVAYRELRALEHQIIARRRELDVLDGTKQEFQTAIQSDYAQDTKIRMSNFAGIEIEEWPAAIAETAMLLVDHQANQDMADLMGQTIVRLPIDQTNQAQIVHGNALRTDWASVLEPTPTTYIAGNPPFIGQYSKTDQQKQDAKDVWGDEYDGYLDYVTCWYKKSVDYFGEIAGRFAFVSTNSIAQGQPVPALFRPIFNRGWRIRFAHQSFPWVTEAADGAAVHCVIIGFDRRESRLSRLFTYPVFGGKTMIADVKTINAYLLDNENVYVEKRTRTLLSPELTPVVKGSQPTGTALLVSDTEYPTFDEDPIASKYLRPFYGADELIHDLKRWCLWMSTPGFDVADIEKSDLLRLRTEEVRDKRLASTKAPTRAAATTPWLFTEIRQFNTSYLAIPRHFSENRAYATTALFEPDRINGDANFSASDPDGFLFAIISSSMFITWQRAIGGALESRLRFSNTIVWNNLPLPPVDPELRQQIIAAGQAVLDARALHPDKSLAQHYEPGNLTPELQAAHDALDVLVDRAFGAEKPCQSNDERLPILFQRFIELTEAEKQEKEKAAAAKASKKRGRKCTVSARTPKEGADSSLKGSGTEDEGSSHA